MKERGLVATPATSQPELRARPYGLENDARCELNPVERSDQSLAITAVQMDVVTRGVGDLRPDGSQVRNGFGFEFALVT